MDRTPVRALNASVSCESIEVPEYQPLTERHSMKLKGMRCANERTERADVQFNAISDIPDASR